jgi:hypothetical protein
MDQPLFTLDDALLSFQNLKKKKSDYPSLRQRISATDVLMEM